MIDWFAADENHNLVYTSHDEKRKKDVYMVALREAGNMIGENKAISREQDLLGPLIFLKASCVFKRVR